MKYDCIIIGGGAAGLMCAATAGYRGRKTLVLDHANKVGKKILMSGGGRCNFTNYFVEPDNYISKNEHFCKSALSRYTQYDFIDLVGRYELAFHEKAKGQLFCDNKASDILDILLKECELAGVEIKTRCEISSVIPSVGGSGSYTLETSQGEFICDSLVVACGGLSIPTMGATSFGFDLAKQFGLDVLSIQPSLVPYTFSDKWLDISKQLSGVSMEVEISTKSANFHESFLFTHRGISGPAVLQITNYWNAGDEVSVNFFPGVSLAEKIKAWREEGVKSELKTLLTKVSEKPLAKNFVNTWLDLCGENKPVSRYSNDEIDRIVEHFQSWTFKPSGTEGYRTAEVTLGGVNTDGVSSKTFEAKEVKGLFFIGEVLDVTGWLGGFNFQWAWASGWCAGQYV